MRSLTLYMRKPEDTHHVCFLFGWKVVCISNNSGKLNFFNIDCVIKLDIYVNVIISFKQKKVLDVPHDKSKKYVIDGIYFFM